MANGPFKASGIIRQGQVFDLLVSPKLVLLSSDSFPHDLKNSAFRVMSAFTMN